MKRKNTKRKQQDCDVVTKAIDSIEQAASVAKKVYRVIEPIAKAILTRGKKVK